MKRIITLLTTLLTITLLATTSCQRKDLLEPHNHYNLVIKANFDSLALSQLLSNKDGNYTTPGEPKTTQYIIFEKNTQKIIKSGKFQGREGGLYLPEGMYDVMLYTSDFNELDANFFRGLDKKETAETYTRQSPLDDAAPRTDVTQMYMVEPDPTFALLKENIVVFEGDESNVLEVNFVQKSFKYYLTIKATGLHQIHTAQMKIGGMYTSAFLGNEDHRMNEAGTQIVDLEIIRSRNPGADLGEGELYGEFWSFGPNQREDIPHSILLHFINGTVITIKLQEDLTSQIKAHTKGGEIIVKEVIEVKGPPSGFQPGVGDWDNKDVEIII